MGSSLNNDSTDYGDVYETTTPPYVVVCPELPGTKPNLPQGACDERLARRKIPRECRTCKGIVDTPKQKKKRQPVGTSIENPSLVPCACGKERETGFIYCPSCKVVRDIKRKEYRKGWYQKRRDAQNKICGICKGDLENKKHKYCEACKPEAKRRQKIRANERRVMERKQQKEM